MAAFDEFISGLKQKLSGPLPGLSSQLKMASARRIIQQGLGKVTDDAKKGGVLILFYPFNEIIYLVFIKRTEYPGVHSGQVSFPGGGWQSGDKDIVKTALREAEEEIGLNGDSVTTIGTLTELFIPPSNFLVTPVVGYINHRPIFKPDPGEVDRILEIPLSAFIHADKKKIKEISVFPGLTMNVPCFYIDREVIWGATAMIISELIDVISPGS